MNRATFLAFASLTLACAHNKAKGPMSTTEPPVAEKKPHVTEIHGEKLVDDYYWMRDKKDPQVIAYLEAENAYTEATMAHTKALQKTLYDEMLARIKEDDTSVPYRKDNYWYYSRTESKKAYRIYCRKKGTLEAEEQVILDGNALAEGKEYMRVGSFEVSPDHKWLAYGVDYDGSEHFALHFKNLETGEVLEEHVPETYYSLAWGNDNKSVFYTVVDEAVRPFKVLRHDMGTDPKNDVVVHHEPDEAFFVSVTKTRSEKYLVIEMESAITTESLILDADTPRGKFSVVQARKNGVEYYISHHGERFFIRTNEDALNFKLMEAPAKTPGKDNWKEVIPHRDDVALSGVDAFRDHLVLYERQEGLPKIKIRKLADNSEHSVAFEDPAYDVWADANAEFDTTTLRFVYTSLVQPSTTYDYDMNTKAKALKKQKEVLGYDASKYTSERIWATSKDGTKVPISLVYKKGFKKDGKSPMHLVGYGSYGYSYDAGFDSDRFSLIDRGWSVGIAHIRGGGELGRKWKEDGKFEKKTNTFIDFIACAEHLVANEYTSSDRLGISGRSAGGLLMGAVLNMKPGLFKAAIAGVPFVDVVNTMLDATIPLTVIEWEEWGNPNEKRFFDVIKKYSPYDNVTAQAYPNVLVLAGLNDPRVQYWEPAKWTAKLRATKTDNNWLLLKTEMGAGHGGQSGRYGQLEDEAFEYAFFLDRIGERTE